MKTHSKYKDHSKYKQKCKYLDRSFGADWVTCLHKDNPTACKVCSDEHCPQKER